MACTQQNQHLEKKIIKLRKIQKNIVPKNKKKCDVTDVQDESIEDFSIETFLSFFYVIRNHYVHNGQTATGEITNKENLKHKLDFLIFLNNELENFVLNLHFTLITKQFNLKES
ncbi:MAG: hypothetical protein IPN94_10895 [Sphingobacteriales bacterium]|nr:hypothetical protein [Sphingobacteriales bacterium]